MSAFLAAVLALHSCSGGAGVGVSLFFQLEDRLAEMRLDLYQDPDPGLCATAPMESPGPWVPTTAEPWETRTDIVYGDNEFDLNPGRWGFVFRGGNASEGYTIGTRDLARGCVIADLEKGVNPNVTLEIIEIFWPGLCGDGHLDPEEMCDDGNTDPASGDTDFCASDCLDIPVRTLSVVPTAGQYQGDIVAAGGDYFVAYRSDGIVSPGETSPFVVLQKFDANAVAQRVGSIFNPSMNVTTTGVQEEPSIAATGSMVGAVWLDFNSIETVGPGDVRFRWIDASAGTGAHESILNSEQDGVQIEAVIGGNGTSDNMLVAWTSSSITPQDVKCRRVQAGAAVGSDTDCASNVSGDQNQPAVAVGADGTFAVAWTGPDSGGRGIYLRFFDTNLTPVAAETVVNTSTAGDQTHPALAYDADGRLLVVWRDGSSVKARLIDETGTPDGDEFVVSGSGASTSDDRKILDVAGGTGVFIVVWVAPGTGVKGRLVTGANAFGVNRIVSDDPGNEPFTDTGEFPVTPEAFSGVASAQVATNPNGTALVIWEDRTGGTLDVRGRVVPTS